MRNNDARLLPPLAQETLRRRAVAAINNGMSQTEAAKVFGVSRSSIAKWMKYFREGGEKALTIKKRGRPPGKQLAPWQSAQVVRTIIDLVLIKSSYRGRFGPAPPSVNILRITSGKLCLCQR